MIKVVLITYNSAYIYFVSAKNCIFVVIVLFFDLPLFYAQRHR